MSLEKDRKKLDRITEKLVKLISDRNKIVEDVGKIKKKLGIPIVNVKREAEVVGKARKIAEEMKVDQDLAEEIIRILIKYAKKIEVSK